MSYCQIVDWFVGLPERWGSGQNQMYAKHKKYNEITILINKEHFLFSNEWFIYIYINIFLVKIHTLLRIL